MKDYWQKRFEQIEQDANTKGVRYARTLEKKYQLAIKEINGKIASWYERLAINNKISVEDAHKLLNANELKEFKWTLEEYIKYGRENAINKLWLKELENASAKVHIRRLDALKLEIEHQIQILMDKYQQDLFENLKSVYEDSYYKTIYTVQQGTSVGWAVATLDENIINKVLNKPWSVSGVNFSNNIWQNKTKLINILNQELSRIVLTGDDCKSTVKRVSNDMGVSLSSAKRLIYTEHNYFCTLAKNDGYKECGIDEYEIICTLDSLTCSKCGAKDKEHYPISEMEIGVNAPPFHPNCRCTTAPYSGLELEGAVRASRNEKGKTIFIKDMSYTEWKKQQI